MTVKPETIENLARARSILGKAARKVAARVPAQPADQQIIIGFGTARDWIRWAASLDDLEFNGSRERNSARKAGITESVRFGQLWTATNALFTRDDVLALAKMGKLPQPELDRFRILYDVATVDPGIEGACLKNLHQLMDMECDATGVVAELGATPTMWEVIDQKYSTPKDRQRGIGKLIRTALDAKTLPRPDGPQYIYGARNWSVHGMLLTSFFRGSKEKYRVFNRNITHLLSEVLLGSARHFESMF